MATILLSAAGAAIGTGIGGTVAGMSTAVVGRAVGATLGRLIDERIMGAGSEPVVTGKVDRLRLTGAAEGAVVPQVFGRVRVGGQVIWASDFIETATVSGGAGKGAPRAPQTTAYSYSVSLAIALCEGEISHVARVWADGEEIAPSELGMTVYRGDMAQLPDPVMEAVEGAGMVPAYRGTAYVVIEELALERFGNRVPQFSFEVVRVCAASSEAGDVLARAVRAVAMIPGTGEYALATTPVHYSGGAGSAWPANVNTALGVPDFSASLAALEAEAPALEAASLVVSWFGGDLRCGSCEIRPKVESRDADGQGMPWVVSGLGRAQAQEVPRVAERVIYGGTPADASVIEAIMAMKAAGKRVMFYPFVLMDQLEGNSLPDPYGGAEQAQMPWRGRISASVAPGGAGSPDGTAAMAEEVAAFFGQAQASDFNVSAGTVGYAGPDEWRFRRFILHNAALCAAAGGVDAFCIGSEMRGLTTLRGAGNSFPAVAQLRALAAEVRAILGPEVKIGYAADWSEYFGYHPQDGSGDVFFHLDPLWADDNVDFIGIDNYMPLSDWRDGKDHADAAWGRVHNTDYLTANVAGGEGYDWYYTGPEAQAAQRRTEIVDGAHGEHWIWRYKDIRGWWEHQHHERIGGVRASEATDWVPMSKPVWFTELGCAAVDKGTNAPNRFVDLRSSESGLPPYSDGTRDDLIQIRYLQAMARHWGMPENNPVSPHYGGPMVDMGNAFVWAWDARPFPFFPNNGTLWADGVNFHRGHWINGRLSVQTLADVVAEICARAGLQGIDVSGLVGGVRGYVVDEVTDARAMLQPLMLTHGFDAVERDGILRFVMRGDATVHRVAADEIVAEGETDGQAEFTRAAEAEQSGRVRLRFVEADADHAAVAEEAVMPDEATHAVAGSDMPLSLTRGEGRAVAERWLGEARLARDGLRLSMPPSRQGIGAGDLIALEGQAGLWRVDRMEQAAFQIAEAVRVDPALYRRRVAAEPLPRTRAFVAPLPVVSHFLDLPLIRGDEAPHAPHLALGAEPWPGSVAVYSADGDEGYALERVESARATMGRTLNPLRRAPSDRWDEGTPLEVRVISGTFESRSRSAVLNGANIAAIGDGSSGNWELFQFAEAQLVDTDTYWLRGRLRGLAGSDGIMPEDWPEGSWVVLLDGTVRQTDLPPSLRRVARHYRIGPARRPVSDPTYQHRVEAFDGNGLRPLSPCHLRVEASGGGLSLRWVRRGRIDADGWDAPDIPLGEASESYVVRVLAGQEVRREVMVDAPAWSYGAAEIAADGGAGLRRIEVAQVSASYGAGPAAAITVAV